MIIGGYRCPYCKGLIDAVVEFVRDHHSEDGMSERRGKITVTSHHPISKHDRKVTRAVKGEGYQGTAVTEYQHDLVGYCKRCCIGFAVEQMEQGQPMQTPYASALPKAGSMPPPTEAG